MGNYVFYPVPCVTRSMGALGAISPMGHMAIMAFAPQHIERMTKQTTTYHQTNARTVHLENVTPTLRSLQHSNENIYT
jgi:hypothetical protein